MKLRSFALIFAGFGLVAAACSSSSSGTTPTPCNENPWECSANQTCWPQDLAGNFQCLNSGAAKKGDVCNNTVGTPSCGDGLACLQLGGAAGFCAPFCDPTNAAHACASGEQCATITLTGTTTSFKACVPTNTPPVDAGPDANETGTDTGAGDTGASETASDTGASETASDSGTSETATDAGGSDAKETGTETGSDAGDAASSG